MNRKIGSYRQLETRDIRREERERATEMEVEIGINGRLTSGFIVQMIRWHVVVVCCC